MQLYGWTISQNSLWGSVKPRGAADTGDYHSELLLHCHIWYIVIIKILIIAILNQLFNRFSKAVQVIQLIYLLLCTATLAKSLKVFSLERVWESLDPVMSTALVSPNKAFKTFTSVITPSYYIPIMLHYGLQSSTMVLRSCQVRAGTLQHTP